MWTNVACKVEASNFYSRTIANWIKLRRVVRWPHAFALGQNAYSAYSQFNIEEQQSPSCEVLGNCAMQYGTEHISFWTFGSCRDKSSVICHGLWWGSCCRLSMPPLSKTTLHHEQVPESKMQWLDTPLHRVRDSKTWPRYLESLNLTSLLDSTLAPPDSALATVIHCWHCQHQSHATQAQTQQQTALKHHHHRQHSCQNQAPFVHHH